MVASHLADATISKMDVILLDPFILPTGPPGGLDFGVDFSDVFGPLPTQSSPELSTFKPKQSFPVMAKQLNKLRLEVEVKNFEETFGADGDCGDSEKLKGSVGNVVDLPNCIKFEPEDFEVLKVVGRGAFGKVYQVRRRGSSEIYAMKVVRKDKVCEKDHCEYMKAERDILARVDHPFIVKLRFSYQTKYRLYFILDFVNGGHLFFQLSRHGFFREDLARVYAAEMVSAIAYLHSNNILHRDLKPENVLLDAEGHVVLTDFGLAKQSDGQERLNSLCGTVEYMAPEIILGKGHDKAVDWWSLGVLLFEMLTGKPPFVGGNRQKTQEKILKDRVKLPSFLSSEAHSLLKGLLQKEPKRRLGNGDRGSEDVKTHKWFKPIKWRKLEAREIKPSFMPEVSGNNCAANFDNIWTNLPLVDSPAVTPRSGQNLFKEFDFVRPIAAAYL